MYSFVQINLKLVKLNTIQGKKFTETDPKVNLNDSKIMKEIKSKEKIKLSQVCR